MSHKLFQCIDVENQPQGAYYLIMSAIAGGRLVLHVDYIKHENHLITAWRKHDPEDIHITTFPDDVPWILLLKEYAEHVNLEDATIAQFEKEHYINETLKKLHARQETNGESLVDKEPHRATGYL